MNRFFLVLILLITLSFSSIKAQNFSTHQVKKGETIEGISNQYHVSSSDIYQLNPDAKKELKPNTILIIPIYKANKPKITTIRELNGFLEHTTKRKETLYSLSKLYNISEEDIKKYNTTLYSKPLQKGDKIQVPQFKITDIVEATPLTKTYEVLPKEGKWRIAYKFGITINELELLNPNMDSVLKEGQIINVPNLEAEKENNIDEQYSYYKVLPKEGFYRLKLKLGLEQHQLELLNPLLKESGLKEGMILKIPYSHNFEEQLTDVKWVRLIDEISDYKKKHIAIMLPFRLNRVDFDSVSATKQSIKKDPFLNASLDFYSGVMVALDSLKNLGVSLKVDVYDTKYQVGEVSKIITDSNFANLDAVIGPLTTATFDKVASELQQFNVPVVSPIGSNLKLRDNVFQSKPPDYLLKNRIINFVKSTHFQSNIVIISDSKNNDISTHLKNEFNAAKLIQSRKTKTGEDAFFVTKDDIQVALKPGKNIVFLETSNTGFASNVTSILTSLLSKESSQENTNHVEIVLVTTNMNAAFESDQINNSHLSKLQFHFASGSKNYDDRANNSFVNKYYQTFNMTPSTRAVKGFDLTMDVVLRIVTSENLYQSIQKTPVTEYVENTFEYKKQLLGGYYNNSSYLLKYDNLSIVEVTE